MKALICSAAPLLLAALPAAAAMDQQVHGLVDLRLHITDAADSYLDGGLGKFRHGDGAGLSLSHAALTWRGQWESGFGFFAAGQLYEDAAGITEAFLSYRGLPSSSGLRLEARAGLLYPRVSMETPVTAWTSPYTLDFSTLNGWIGEEVRHRGVEASLTRLGRFSGGEHDFTLAAALFRGNDPTGAMVAWHGWVSGNRQSLQHERLKLPPLEPGFVPPASDAFRELDGRVGWHASFEWEWEGRLRLLAGRYDNNADPEVVEDLQWAWTTRFSHLGIHWELGGGLELLAQYLDGDTLMRSPMSGADLVNNDFRNGWLMLSKSAGRHRFSARVEEFSVRDLDHFPGDDNDEYGKALTLSWRLQLDRRWSLQAEYSLLDGTRPSRAAVALAPAFREDQWQLALRHYF